jgi:hypothetical protein
LNDLVLAVDQVCTGARDLASACTRVQDKIARAFIADEERGILPWPTLVERAKQGNAKEGGDSVITLSRRVRSIEDNLKDLVMPLLARQYRGALTQALESQRGGLLLKVVDNSPIPGLSSGAEAEWETADNWSTQWQAVQRLAGPEGAQAMQLTGLVIASRKDSVGDPVLTLDPNRTSANHGPAFLRLLAFLFALTFLSVHGAAAVVNWVRADRRGKAIRNYYAGKSP